MRKLYLASFILADVYDKTEEIYRLVVAKCYDDAVEAANKWFKENFHEPYKLVQCRTYEAIDGWKNDDGTVGGQGYREILESHGVHPIEKHLEALLYGHKSSHASNALYDQVREFKSNRPAKEQQIVEDLLDVIEDKFEDVSVEKVEMLIEELKALREHYAK